MAKKDNKEHGGNVTAIRPEGTAINMHFKLSAHFPKVLEMSNG